MDNFTHSLAGWALGQAGLKTASRKGLAALILGANMPDVDVFFGWSSWAPLATHRGFTHGVGGILLMPPLLAGLLLLLDRWQVSRGASFQSGLAMRPGALLGLAYVGAISHPLLDVLTTYSVQLLSPFSNDWYHADGLFIIDVWLWLLLGGAIFWSQGSERHAGRWRRPAQAAIAVGLAYIGLNLLISNRAVAAVLDEQGERPVQSIFASPPPIQSWRRNLVWRQGDCYRWSSFDPLGGGIEPATACRRAALDEPLVREEIRRNPRLRKFLRWSVMPIAQVRRERCSALVTIGDARYQDSRSRSRLIRQARVPLDAPGCQAARRSG